MESVSSQRGTLTKLLAAWDRWDKHPADPKAADNMIEATRAVAAQLDMPYPAVRGRMQELRRRGNTKAQVIHKMGVLMASTRP